MTCDLEHTLESKQAACQRTKPINSIGYASGSLMGADKNCHWGRAPPESAVTACRPVPPVEPPGPTANGEWEVSARRPVSLPSTNCRTRAHARLEERRVG